MKIFQSYWGFQLQKKFQLSFLFWWEFAITGCIKSCGWVDFSRVFSSDGKFLVSIFVHTIRCAESFLSKIQYKFFAEEYFARSVPVFVWNRRQVYHNIYITEGAKDYTKYLIKVLSFDAYFSFFSLHKLCFLSPVLCTIYTFSSTKNSFILHIHLMSSFVCRHNMYKFVYDNRRKASGNWQQSTDWEKKGREGRVCTK